MSYTGSQLIASAFIDLKQRLAAGGLTAPTPTPTPTPGDLEPNPGDPVVRIAGPVSSVAPAETNSTINFIQATIAEHPSAVSLGTGLLADNSSPRLMQAVDTTHVRGVTLNANGTTAEGQPYPAYQLIPNGFVLAVGSTIRIDRFEDAMQWSYLDTTTNEFVSMFREAVPKNSPYFGTKVAIPARGTAKYTQVSYGGSAIPLRIVSQTFTPGYKPQAMLAYTGSPDGYECGIFGNGGDMLVPWHTAILSDITKGNVTATAQYGAPTSQFGLSPRIKWRQTNLPSVEVSQLQQMPAGKATLGMNLTSSDHTGGEQIFKDMLYVNDGWRDGGSGNINPKNNPELFNANGDLISKGGFNAATQAFGRCVVPGARCEVTWEGGKDPLADVALNGGVSQNVSFGNPVRSARKITFDYNHSWDTPGFGYIEQKGFYSDTPVTNIRLKMVATSWEGGAFQDEYVEAVRKHYYSRLMDVMGSNAANYIPVNDNWLYEWSDRSVPGKKLGPLGWAPEHIIELVTRSGTLPWIMLPAASSPDYDRRFIRGLFYGEGMVGGVKLPSWAIVYLEKANEWFNAQFGVYKSAWPAARANGRATSGMNENAARIAEMAYRIKTCFEAVNDNYPPGRLKKMVMGNPSDTFDLNTLYETYGLTDYDIAGCAYYFMNVEFSQAPHLWPGKDLQALFDFAYSTIPGGLEIIRKQAKWAKDHGYGFWIYEGQQHWLERAYDARFSDEAFYRSFQQDDRMYDLIRAWINTWTANFDGGLTFYNAVGEIKIVSGAWGARLHQGVSALAKSPKHRAYVDAVADLAMAA